MGVPEKRVFGRNWRPAREDTLSKLSPSKKSTPPKTTIEKATPPKTTITKTTPAKKFTPSKREPINKRLMDNREQFIKMYLSMDLSALQINYLEMLVTNHLRKHGMLTLKLPKTLPLKYDSHSQFMETYLPLIYHNCWAQIVEDYNKLNLKPLKLYVSKVLISGLYCNIQLRCRLPSKETHTESFFINNWLAFLQPENSSTGNKMFAFIDSYYKVDKKHLTAEHLLPVLKPVRAAGEYLVQMEYSVRVLISTNEPAWRQFAKGQTITLTPIYYLQPTLRQTTTISSLASKDSFKEAVLEPDRTVFQLDSTNPEGFKLHEKKRFNEEQKKAIFACYNAVETNKNCNVSKTVMIQGPPGTGKTHTLVGIVKNLLVNCEFDSENSPMRILICAPSNGAVDNIALRLIADRNFLSAYAKKDNTKDIKLNILRIGQRAKIPIAVLPYHLEYKLDKIFPPPVPSEDRKDWFKMRERFLLEAHIILSTLNSVQAGGMMKVFEGVNFRCVIIDEAGQCSEPELILPLVYETSKLILIGDHKQLPATVISNFAQDKNYGRSMLERAYEHFNALEEEEKNAGDQKKKESKEANPMLTLKEQFRMRADIVAYPSATFYGGRLKTPPGTGENAAIPLTPYQVFDVTDTKESSMKTVKWGKMVPSTSKSNLGEVTFVLKLIVGIFAKLGYPKLERRFPIPGQLKMTIGVITFYQGQKDELQKCLKWYLNGMLLRYVDVNTVDGFQGQERDIVILSCVRAFETDSKNKKNGGNSVGFLRSEQRMNVALTRAKSALYVVLNAATFIAAKAPLWQGLIEDAKARDCLHSLTSKVLSKELKEMLI